jgi:hypothetical protein
LHGKWPRGESRRGHFVWDRKDEKGDRGTIPLRLFGVGSVARYQWRQ